MADCPSCAVHPNAPRMHSPLPRDNPQLIIGIVISTLWPGSLARCPGSQGGACGKVRVTRAGLRPIGKPMVATPAPTTSCARHFYPDYLWPRPAASLHFSQLLG